MCILPTDRRHAWKESYKKAYSEILDHGHKRKIEEVSEAGSSSNVDPVSRRTRQS